MEKFFLRPSKAAQLIDTNETDALQLDDSRGFLYIESAGALLLLRMSWWSGSRRRGGEWVTYIDYLNDFNHWLVRD